jgi:hypothetical protein
MPYTGPEPARRPLSSDDITDGIVSTADLADSAVTTAKITNNAVTAAKVSADVAQLGKNLLINGSCSVAQRGSVSGIGGSQTYTACDRFKLFFGTGGEQGRVTTTQDTDVPSGGGFSSSLKIDCTTAESAVASGELFALSQDIEAQNIQHLLYGNAAAKTLALSFWFKSPKSGTHCVALRQPDGSRSYVREFTVASADTWEKHTVTFAGDASGTINNDTGSGLSVVWPLVAGSDFQVTADQWAAGSDYATSNQQNLLDNTANNIYITGVQLEVGSVVTDFEDEDISITQFKCDRYYQRYDFPTSNKHIGLGWCNAVRESKWIKWLRAPMRPDNNKIISVSAVGHFSHYDWDGSTGGIGLNDTVAIQDQHAQQVTVLFRHSGGGSYTVGEGMEQRTTTNNAWMAFEDEL